LKTPSAGNESDDHQASSDSHLFLPPVRSPKEILVLTDSMRVSKEILVLTDSVRVSQSVR
jgi:hypothetical protein